MDFEKFAAQQGLASGFTPPLTLDEKLNILGIDNIRGDKVKLLPFNVVDLELSECKCPREMDIDLELLCGINRNYEKSTNWMELLDNLHRPITIEQFKCVPSFESFMRTPPAGLDLPIVIEREGYYYIDGGGKHRLTIAKCLGIKSAKVIIKEVKT